MTDLFNDEVTRHGRAGPGNVTAVAHELARTTARHQVFDIYLPDVLWTMGATQIFVNRILGISPGATIYEAATGVWQSTREQTRVLRVSVEIVDASGRVVFDVNNLRGAVRDAATNLLVDLRSDFGHVEQAIFFNDWPAYGSLVSRR